MSAGCCGLLGCEVEPLSCCELVSCGGKLLSCGVCELLTCGDLTLRSTVSVGDGVSMNVGCTGCGACELLSCAVELLS